MIEIKPLKKLNAEITIPGSKYVANRALIIAALANGTSILRNIPENEDIDACIDSLKKLGVSIERDSSSVMIKGTNGELKPASIDVKNSGTLLRFILGISALAKGDVQIKGGKRISERPIQPLLDSLKGLGTLSESSNGFTPVTMHGGTFTGGKTKIRGDESSQFISSLLIIAPFAKKDVEIQVEVELISKPYVDMTIDMMEKFNVAVKRKGHEWFQVKAGQRYKAIDLDIPGDWSSASYFFAAASLLSGSVKVKGLDFSINQGEKKFPDLLVKMGGMYRRNSSWLQMIGFPMTLAIDEDMGDMPDVVQTLAVVASASQGITKITNIAHLKHKESDRIKDSAEELRKLGIKVQDTDDSLVIHGGNPQSALIDSHNDHRMAMSFAILGLKTGMRIMNPGCVNKSFPQFWDKLRELGAEIHD